MGFFVLILLLVAVAAGIYLMDQSQFLGSRGPTPSGNKTSLELDYVYENTNPKRSGTIEFEVHPLERLAMMGQNLGNYAELAAKKLSDEEEIQRLKDSSAILADRISQIDLEALIASLHRFTPLQGSYFMSLEVEIGTAIEELTHYINQLPQAPQLMEVIESRTDKLLKFCDELMLLIREWEQAQGAQELIHKSPDLVLNKLQILTDQQVLETELQDFLNLYFAMRAFEIFDSMNRDRVNEVRRQMDYLGVILSRCHSQMNPSDYQEIQRLQKSMLSSLRLVSDFYFKFFLGITGALEKLQDFRLKLFSENLDIIVRLISQIQNEYQPMAGQFSSRGGSAEADYNKAFQKILGSSSPSSRHSPIQGSSAENLMGFLNNRIEDIDSFMDSDLKVFLHGPMRGLWQQIRQILLDSGTQTS
ncbi:MAG: hypothetical protein H3C47_06160 [Candidatus Cloacimonetes bacterium]|nr:hypothetical protein [Candidatus Cloacimonadota bacterium]